MRIPKNSILKKFPTQLLTREEIATIKGGSIQVVCMFEGNSLKASDFKLNCDDSNGGLKYACIAGATLSPIASNTTIIESQTTTVNP